MKKIFLIFFLLIGNLSSFEIEQSKILFLMQSGDHDAALNLYREYANNLQKHDFELLQNLGLIILEQGCKNSDLEIQLLSLFGAGIAFNEKVLTYLEDGLKKHQPEIQLVSLNFLSRYQNENADLALQQALASNFILIRLEAAYHLAKKKSMEAVLQTESLMCKVPKEALPLFPQIFAAAGTKPAISILRKMFTNRDENVRLATIIAATENRRDDLLPSIRIIATHQSLAEKECAAYALGAFKDNFSYEKLEQMAASNNCNLRLAASHALCKLGRSYFIKNIQDLAEEEDLFAISLLSEYPESKDLLIKLLEKKSFQVRANAAISLLKLKIPNCLPTISELLLKDSRDLAIIPIKSPGKSLTSYKIIPSAKQNLQDSPLAEIALKIKEELALLIFELNEEEYLKMAEILLQAKEQTLVPIVTVSLAETGSQKAKDILKKFQQKTGAPLIRNWCNLCLYKLNEEGPFLENLIKMTKEKNDFALIGFKSTDLTKKNELKSTFNLTTEETTKLLIDVFSAFTEKHEERGILALIDAIQYGHPKNKYPLAGLLIRAVQ